MALVSFLSFGFSVGCAVFRLLVLFPSDMCINKDCKKKRNILSFFLINLYHCVCFKKVITVLFSGKLL